MSLSFSSPSIKTEMDGKEDDKNGPLSLEILPDVVLQHLLPFLQWSSRSSLSQVNSRFKSHYGSHLREGTSLSIKGQISVGVGDRIYQGKSVSFLSEFYTIRCEMDEKMVVEWILKMESGVRTVVNTHYERNVARESVESVQISSKEYLERKLEWILKKFQFKKIHLGVPGLAHLFKDYDHTVDEIGVSDEVEYLQLAERLQPKKLTVFQPTQLGSKRGALNLKKFPQLKELRLYGIPLDLDQFLESKIVKVHADTVENKIKAKHVKKIIQNWTSGTLNYIKIDISGDDRLSRTPIPVPHDSWSDDVPNNEQYYDSIENSQKIKAVFLFSPKSFHFAHF